MYSEFHAQFSVGSFIAIVCCWHHQNIDIKQIPVLLGEISIAPLIFCILHQADGELPQLLFDNLAGFLGQQVEDLFKLIGGRKW